MFKLLFGVIAIGAIIMALLFFYWLKYVYVEDNEKDERRQYSPLSQNSMEKNNNNGETLFKVDPNFINKRKNKKA